MRLEQLLDARRAHPALQAPDNALVLHERQGRDGRDAKPLRELGLLVDVDLRHAQATPLLARDVREETFHAPGRSRVGRSKKDEQWTGVASHRTDSVSSLQADL